MPFKKKEKKPVIEEEDPMLAKMKETFEQEENKVLQEEVEKVKETIGRDILKSLTPEPLPEPQPTPEPVVVPEVMPEPEPVNTTEQKPKFSLANMFTPKETPNPEYEANVTTEKEAGEGLSGKLDSINNKLDKMLPSDVKKNLKDYKMPGNIKGQLKKMAEKGKVLVILLKTNKAVKPIVTDIVDGFISIDGIPHNCSMDFIYLWKGKYPCIVLNEWDLNPIGAKEYYEALKEKRTATPIAVVMRMIKSGEKLIEQKKQFGGSMWIWIGLGAIAIIYLFLKKP